jgi:hypothetical protein
MKRRKRRSTKAKVRHRRRRKAVYAAPKRRRRRSSKRKATYRRKRRYARNPKRYRVRARRRKSYRRRRRNPSGVGSLARRSYSAGRSLFSMGMAKNVIAGVAGFAGVKYVEGFIPYQPTGFIGGLLKKSLAAIGAYTIAGFIPGVSRSMKKYVLYGAAVNMALDLIQDLPSIAPGIAEATRMNGYSGYGQGSLEQAMPSRYVPIALTPTALN